MVATETSINFRRIALQMSEPRAKTVTIDHGDSSNPLVLQKYSALLNHLKKDNTLGNADTSDLTESKLATFVINLRSAIERLCGKDVSKPRPITKLPMSLYQDFSVNGSVAALLAFMCREAAKAKCNPNDLFSENKKAGQLLVKLDKELNEKGLLKRPRVFLNKVPVGKLNLLSKIVQDHGGSMVSSEEAASHVIDWNEDVDSTPDSADDFIRILEVKGPTDAVALPGGGKIEARSGCALVHWWYYPDSYNEWIPDTEISAGDSPDLASVGTPSRDKWYVCCRYILDCEVFNEWGNPVDYENENSEALAAEEAALEQLSAAAGAQEGAMAVDEPSRAALSKKAKGRKRFSQLATGAGDKDRLQSARDAPILGALSGAEKLMPDAIPPSLRPGSSAQILDLGAAGGDSKLVTGPDVGSKRSAADAQLDSAAVAECVLPSGATEPSWFQHGAASEFEAQVLGQTCTADPADYVKVRNGIIALCTQSPLQYITATECRRKLPGDVSKILQVHEFLNAFAIINSRARREARPDAPSSLLTASSAALASGHAQKAASGSAAHWSAAEDARLLKLIEAHRGAQGTSVDWKAVSAALQQEFGAVRSAADCAARFVERGLGDGADSVTASGDLASLIRRLAETAKAAPAQYGSAVSCVARSAAEAKLAQHGATIAALSETYLHTKLELLAEKVALLQSVEAAFEAERARLEADKRELQVLRAQLALTQQSLLPVEAAPGALP